MQPRNIPLTRIVRTFKPKVHFKQAEPGYHKIGVWTKLRKRQRKVRSISDCTRGRKDSTAFIVLLLRGYIKNLRITV